MEGLLDFGGFEGITDVAPLDDAASSIPDIGALADAAPIDDALQAAYQDWLGAGNEGTIQDFLTAQEPTQASIDVAPAAFAGQPLESIGDFKPGEIVGLEKSAFSPDASFGGRFMADAAPAPFGGSFAAPSGGVSLPRPDVASLAFNPQSFADAAPTTLASVGVGENVFAPPVAPLTQFGGLPSREAPSLPPMQMLDGGSPAQLDQAGNRRMPSFMEPGYSDGFNSSKKPDPRAPLRQGIIDTAKALGIRPVDLATAISYETAGTFDPTKRGPTTQWGQHRGLIQFGEPQARKYGVDWDRPLESQLGPDGAVAKYLRDTGVKPGMGLLDVYSAINAGGVGRYNRTDANNGGAPGTVRDKVETQMEGHRAKAEALMSGEGGVADAPGAFRAAAARQANEARNVAARDPGMFTEASPRDVGVRSPVFAATRMPVNSGVAPAAAAAPPSAPQGRTTMPQISPDEELYSMGLVRDPAGGGMIENVAIRPPGMAMGSDGAYIDAGAVPIGPAAPTGGLGGFGGIASGISRMFGGGESAAASPASAPASRGAGGNAGGSWMTPQMDAFLGGLSAALMSNNGAAFAPTYQAILDSANKKAETGSQQAAIAMVLAKQGLPAEEAALLAKSPTAAQMALETMKQQREMQQREAGLREINAAQNPAAVPASPPLAAPAPATPSDGQAPAAQPAPQAPAMSSAEEQRQRLQARRSQLSRITSADPVVKAAIDRQIADIDAQMKAIPDPLDRQKKELDLQKARRDLEKDDGGKIRAEIAARREEVAAQGKNPNDPRWESYIMTGKMPREDAQPLSASDKKTIREEEENILKLDNTLAGLRLAKELNPKTFSGLGASTRAEIGVSGVPGANWIVDKDKALATNEFNKIMGMESVTAMADALKGATTDFELKTFVSLLGDPSTPIETRGRIIDRMIKLSEEQKSLASRRVKEMRDGDYYKPDDKKNTAKSGSANAPVADNPRQTAPAETPGPVRVSTPQEAMALQPGTQFITPDGRVKVR